ncbi:MAG: hypothetical protein WCS78_04495 [Bacilli bacterium]
MTWKKLQKNKKLTAILYLTTRILVLGILGFAIYQMIKEQHYEYDSRNAFIITQCVILLAYSFMPMIVEKQFKVEIPEAMEVLFIFFGIGSLLIGEIIGAYRINSWWDGVMHFMSGSLIAIFSFSLINLIHRSTTFHINLNPFFIVLFAFCFSMTLAVLWEIIEFTIDRTSLSNMQRYRDSITGNAFIGQAALNDTMYDFIFGSLGAMVVCTLEYFKLKCKKKFSLMIEPIHKKD